MPCRLVSRTQSQAIAQHPAAAHHHSEQPLRRPDITRVPPFCCAAALEAMGCDEELWSKIRSKKPLISLAEAGDEAAVRERLEMLRKSPSITGFEAELPAELVAWGYTQELWSKIKSKKPLVELAAAGDEAAARARLVKLEAAIAAEAEAPAKSPPKPTSAPKAARAPKKAKPLSEGYALSGELPDGFDAAPVEALLAERVAAKLGKDYALADQLQANIEALGVFVNDRTRTWSTVRATVRGLGTGGLPPTSPSSEGCPVTLPLCSARARRRRPRSAMHRRSTRPRSTRSRATCPTGSTPRQWRRCSRSAWPPRRSRTTTSPISCRLTSWRWASTWMTASARGTCPSRPSGTDGHRAAASDFLLGAFSLRLGPAGSRLWKYDALNTHWARARLK